MGAGKDSMEQKTGDADIKMVGHTESAHFGTNSKAQPKTMVKPTDLTIQTTGN